MGYVDKGLSYHEVLHMPVRDLQVLQEIAAEFQEMKDKLANHAENGGELD